MKRGMKKGQVIGQVQLLQRLLKRPQTSDKTLTGRDLKDLQAMVARWKRTCRMSSGHKLPC